LKKKASIVVTGTEILSGLITDRNGPWLASELQGLGFEVSRITVVGDRLEDVVNALKSAKESGNQLIITTGGLGPTADDLTVAAVAEFYGLELTTNQQALKAINEKVDELLRSGVIKDRQATEKGTLKQSKLPTGAVPLAPVGTAPGSVVQADDLLTVVLPGPPTELKPMWREALETSQLQALTENLQQTELHLIRAFGLPESELAQALREIEATTDIAQLEVTTCLRRWETEISVRFNAEAQSQYRELLTELEKRFKQRIYSTDGKTVDTMVAELLSGSSVAVAESCTGGLIAARLTELPGSSSYMKGGTVAYSNSAKVERVGVNEMLIERFGAVSEEVASLLAEGAIDTFNSEYGIGVTGIAGPGGGSEEKPVGQVCFSVAKNDGTRVTETLQLPGSRSNIRERATTVAMQLLLRLLKGQSSNS